MVVRSQPKTGFVVGELLIFVPLEIVESAMFMAVKFIIN